MKSCISALSFAIVAAALVAAPVMADGVLVTTGKSFKHDTSPPLRDIVVAPSASALAGFNVEIPIAARPGGSARADVPQGPDGSLQDRFRPIPGASPTPPVDVSFSALSDDDNSDLFGSFDFNTRVCSFKLAAGGGGTPTFTLFAPTPGNAGVLNTFATTGATPNSKVNFVGGSAAGSTVFNVPNCGAISIDVGGNTRRLGFDTASGSGENDLMRVIPGSQAGNTVHLQAIDQATCTKSNVVVHTF